MSEEGEMIKADRDISFEVVWERVTPKLVEEVGDFWAAEGAGVGNPQEMEARAQQLMILARNEDKKIVAVSSAECLHVPRLMNNKFYYFRCFIASHRRREGLTMELSHKAREYMHPLFLSGECTEAKGFYYSLESKELEASWLEAIRIAGGVEHSFIGTDEKQRRLYVGWFDGATID